jgi:hypothetical protein
LDPASRKTWNWIQPTRKLGNGACQREKFELDPAKGTFPIGPASRKIWNLILPAGKDGTKSFQGENLELDLA